jgi:hypothetical protein
VLTEQFGHLDLEKILLSPEHFHPFPHAWELDGWARVTQQTKSEWVATAEQYKDYTWPAMTMAKYLLFSRTGENLNYLMSFFERRSVLGVFVLAECLEGEGRFLDQIINGIFCICEETSWMTPFDLSFKKEKIPASSDRLVDLSCSETGALLAWTYYLCKEPLDKISPRIGERIEKEVHDRLIVPYLERDDYWWMGFVDTPRVNNWNPWCNRNMLMCFLLLERDAQKRIRGIRKIMKSLDVYLRRYAPDGCCDEGPMYWGAAGGGLHVCLELLYLASSGVIDIYSEPIVQEIGRYIYRVHIHEDYFVDFADGDARVGISPTVFNYGVSISDENMISLGAGAKPVRPSFTNWFGMYEYMVGMFAEWEWKKSASKFPYVREAWMGYSQVMTAREKGGSEKGLFLAAKGGHNAEAHNHNDIGNFIVYVDGKPLLIDLGTEEYTAKTFSAQRFELWYLKSEYHNCPTIRSILQKDGAQFKAKNVNCHLTDSHTELEMDITDAYTQDADIVSWVRTCRLNRGDKASIEVMDDYVLGEPTTDIFYSLMTPCVPHLVSPGLIELEYAQNHRAVIKYDHEHLLEHIEEIQLEESRLQRNWGKAMYRILLSEKNPVAKGIRKITIFKAGDV